MSVRHPSRLLVAAIAGSVAAGTLALTATTPAAAAPATTTYVCSFGDIEDLEEVDVPVTVNITNLPRQLPVDVAVAAGQWQAAASVHFDEPTTAYLRNYTDSISVGSQDLQLVLGDRPVPLLLASALQPLPVAAALNVPMSGGNGEFTPRYWADDLPLELPEYLTLDLKGADGAALFSVDCEEGDDDLGVIGTVSVVKQSAVMTRKLLNKPVKSNKRAKVLVTVLGETGEGAPGELMASIGDRNLVVKDLTDGRVTLKLPKLPVGKHRVTLSYLGSKYVDKVTRNVRVKVVAPPKRRP